MAIDPPIGPTLRTDQAGAIVVPNTATLNFVSGATVAQAGTQANVTVTGSGGTVTSIAPADATLTFSPNPITGTGTIKINLSSANAWAVLQTFLSGLVSNSVSSSASDLTLNGAGANNGILLQANGSTLIDVGAATADFVVLTANTSLVASAGTGLFDISSMTGDTGLSTGDLSWNGAPTKTFEFIADGSSVLQTTSGTLTIDAGTSILVGISAATAIQIGKTGIGTSVLGMVNQTVGSTLTVNSNAIAVTANIHHVGAGLIKTITVPATLTAGAVLQIIPDAAFTYDSTGNIAALVGGGVAIINKVMTFVWDGSKWTPSY